MAAESGPNKIKRMLAKAKAVRMTLRKKAKQPGIRPGVRDEILEGVLREDLADASIESNELEETEDELPY